MPRAAREPPRKRAAILEPPSPVLLRRTPNAANAAAGRSKMPVVSRLNAPVANNASTRTTSQLYPDGPGVGPAARAEPTPAGWTCGFDVRAAGAGRRGCEWVTIRSFAVEETAESARTV